MPARALTPELVLQLQQRAGNAAVGSLLRPLATRRASLLIRRRARTAPMAGATRRTPPVRQRTPVTDAPAPPQTAEEDDVDTSEFTDEPKKAAAKLATTPPAVKATPPSPPLPDGSKAGPPPPKSKAQTPEKPVPPPKPGPKAGEESAPKEAGAVGEIVKKPAPALPPKYEPGEVPPPPAPVLAHTPEDDPAFSKVVKTANMAVKSAGKHPTGKDESAAAQGAALPPANDKLWQAKADRAETMATAKPKAFDEDAFVTAVEAAMAKTAPKNLEEAEDVDEKSAGMKDVVGKGVGAGKKQAAGDVDTKTKEPPDVSKAVEKPVTPMKPLDVAEPGGMKASGAMPAPAPNEQLDLRSGPAQVDREMAEAEITEEQLAESNEPEFTAALEAKKAGEEHANRAPAEVRTAEAQILESAAAQSATAEKSAVGGAKASISAAVKGIGGEKEATKTKDEVKRKEVADGVNSIFDQAKRDVGEILGGLDEKVDAAFTEGEEAVRRSFTADWNERLDDYKDRRYSGLRGPFRWARDKFRGLPSEANQLFQKSRLLYERDMKKLVRGIARLVAEELNRAMARIEQGRKEVAAYVAGLKGDLAKFGQEAATDIADRFNDLDSSVKDKFEELHHNIAQRYAQSKGAVDEEIKEAQEANKGLIDKAVGLVKAAYRAICQVKDLFLRVLNKVGSAIGNIIAHPIRFFENFGSAVKGGVERFVGRIEDHLKKGLMGWLFGMLDTKGIEPPDSFDVPGMLKLVLSVLGLGWITLRERLLRKVGDKGMAALEKGSDIVQKLAAGPAALLDMVLEKLSDFEEIVLQPIKNFVMNTIVNAGVRALLPLLTPATAFIKACQMIYDAVMFIIENARQFAEFIETIIDAVADVARGGAGGVAEKIEDCLGRLLHLAIAFLARMLKLGGIPDKVNSIIDRARKPVVKAIDGVVNTVVKLTAPIWKGARRSAEKVKGKILGGDDSPEGKQQRLEKGVKAGVSAANRFAGKKIGEAILKPALGAIRLRYGLGVLEPVRQGAHWGIHGTVNRMTEPTNAEVGENNGNVKSQALNDLELRLKGKQPSTLEGFQTILNQVAVKFRGQGLRALSAHVSNESSMETLVRATASPGLERTIQWSDIFARADAALLKPFFAKQGFQTYAAISVNGELVGGASVNNSAGHAEENILTSGTWEAALDIAQRQRKSGKVSRIVLAINRTPCPSCTGLLVEAINKAQRNPALQAKTEFVLAPTGVYEPAFAPSPEELKAEQEKYLKIAQKLGTPVYEIVSKVTLRKEEMTLWSHLEALVSAGWDLRQLRGARPKPTSAGITLAEAAHKLAEAFKAQVNVG